MGAPGTLAGVAHPLRPDLSRLPETADDVWTSLVRAAVPTCAEQAALISG